MEISSSLCKLQLLPAGEEKRQNRVRMGGARRITAVSETIFEPKRRAESLEIESREGGTKPKSLQTAVQQIGRTLWGRFETLRVEE